MRSALFGLLILLGIALAGEAGAQGTPGTARSATRAELQSALSLLEASASSPAYSESIRSRARAQAAVVRTRLSQGDFRPGDRIALHVQGPPSSVPAAAGTALVNDTLTVSDGLSMEVPGIRTVSLAGVLRSELVAMLRRELGEVVREPRIAASPLMRMAVVGQVSRPGFLMTSAESPVDALVTLAGGPTATADVTDMRIMRGDTVLVADREISLAISQGTSLDGLGLRDGDVLVVPAQGAPWDRTSVLSIASFFVGPLLTLLAVR